MSEMKFNGVDMVEVPFWSELEDEGLICKVNIEWKLEIPGSHLPSH